MVGLIQKILCNIILKHADEQTLLEIKRKVGLPDDFDYQLNANYSDQEWQNLLAETCKTLGLSVDAAYELYAKEFYLDSVKRFPIWFEISKNSYDFLCRQPVIHNNFASGVKSQEERDAINAKFQVEKINDTELHTHYNSPNKHCSLYINLAKCIIDHYQDEADIVEETCLLKGHPECLVKIKWSKLNEVTQ